MKPLPTFTITVIHPTHGTSHGPYRARRMSSLDLIEQEDDRLIKDYEIIHLQECLEE